MSALSTPKSAALVTPPPLGLAESRRLPRLTRRAFTDLGIWMLVFGVAIGVVFPFVLIPLGIPAELTLKPDFFAATVLAGLVLAGANFLLARWVVESRLDAVSHQMRHVGDKILEATYSGDWSQCSPEQCQLQVDSNDVLGEVAASFNGLVEALDSSRTVQQAISEHSRALAQHLELGDFSAVALGSAVRIGNAAAGAVCAVRDGELDVPAVHRLNPDSLRTNATLAEALDQPASTWIALPTTLEVDAAVLSFTPAEVLIMPLTQLSTPVGALVLAFAEPVPPTTKRLLDTLQGPTGVALNNALAHERFQRLAAIDPLTGCYNRRFGLSRLDEEWSRSARDQAPLGLLALDLDHFKAVNDTYGHLAGDRVLRDAVNAARLVLREGDVLIRTGGEEFLIVLPGAGQHDVEAIGDRIRRAVALSTTDVGSCRLSVTVSLGGGTVPGVQADSAHELIATVDRALYAAKEGGRDRLMMCEPVTRH